MTNICSNKLTISGPSEDIKRFQDGLMNKKGEYKLISSYFPIPQELKETEAYYFLVDIGYDAFFNPDPKGYLRVLECPEIKEHGIKTREELMEFLKKERPECYENALKVNENLFKYGFENWYWWCVVNWGSQWDDQDTELVEQSSTHIVFKFESAYTPPLFAFGHIASLFPELSFNLEFINFDGFFYIGFARWQHGELIEDQWEEFDPDEGLEEDQIPQASTA